MTIRRMIKPALAALVVAGALMTGACSENVQIEAIRKQTILEQERLKQQRILEQHRVDARQETQRRKDIEDAITARENGKAMAAFGKLAAIAAATGGVIGWFIYSVRRLGERHMAERTKRYEQSLKAIDADPHLKPEDRKELLRLAIETNGRPSPLIGYAPGGAA